jgi:hypothetical protein
VTWAPLQNICKQKRSASRHFFIKLSDVFGVLFGLRAQVSMAVIFIKMFMFFTHGRSRNLITPGAVVAVIVW